MFRTCILLMTVLFLSVAAAADNPVGLLKSKQHLVEVFSSEYGPLYSVKTDQGELLASKLTGQDVIERFPTLAPLIQGYADDASLGPKMDKSLDVLGDY